MTYPLVGSRGRSIGSNPQLQVPGANIGEERETRMKARRLNSMTSQEREEYHYEEGLRENAKKLG